MSEGVKIREERVQMMTLKSGDQYMGEVKNNVPHGFGQLYKRNGDLIQGQWKKGKLDGIAFVKPGDKTVASFFGTFEKGIREGYGQEARCGGLIVGDYKNNLFRENRVGQLTRNNDEQHIGCLSYQDCSLSGYCEVIKPTTGFDLKGFFKNGNLVGLGVVQGKGGNVQLTGSFLDGMLVGVGLVEYKSGKKVLSKFKDGKPFGFRQENSNKVTYTGEVDDTGQKTGRAIIQEGDEEYTGDVVYGRRQGFGRVAIGEKRNEDFLYIGNFEDGIKNGVGYMENYTGNSRHIYYGDFLQGEMDGFGYEQIGIEERWVGGFRSGQRHGEGLYFSKENLKFEPKTFHVGVIMLDEEPDIAELDPRINELMMTDFKELKFELIKKCKKVEKFVEEELAFLLRSRNLGLADEFKVASEELFNSRDYILDTLKRRERRYDTLYQQFESVCRTKRLFIKEMGREHFVHDMEANRKAQIERIISLGRTIKDIEAEFLFPDEDETALINSGRLTTAKERGSGRKSLVEGDGDGAPRITRVTTVTTTYRTKIVSGDGNEDQDEGGQGEGDVDVDGVEQVEEDTNRIKIQEVPPGEDNDEIQGNGELEDPDLADQLEKLEEERRLLDEQEGQLLKAQQKLDEDLKDLDTKSMRILQEKENERLRNLRRLQDENRRAKEALENQLEEQIAKENEELEEGDSNDAANQSGAKNGRKEVRISEDDPETFEYASPKKGRRTNKKEKFGDKSGDKKFYKPVKQLEQGYADIYARRLESPPKFYKPKRRRRRRRQRKTLDYPGFSRDRYLGTLRSRDRNKLNKAPQYSSNNKPRSRGWKPYNLGPRNNRSRDRRLGRSKDGKDNYKTTPYRSYNKMDARDYPDIYEMEYTVTPGSYRSGSKGRSRSRNRRKPGSENAKNWRGLYASPSYLYYKDDYSPYKNRYYNEDLYDNSDDEDNAERINRKWNDSYFALRHMSPYDLERAKLMSSKSRSRLRGDSGSANQNKGSGNKRRFRDNKERYSRRSHSRSGSGTPLTTTRPKVNANLTKLRADMKKLDKDRENRLKRIEEDVDPLAVIQDVEISERDKRYRIRGSPGVRIEKNAGQPFVEGMSGADAANRALVGGDDYLQPDQGGQFVKVSDTTEVETRVYVQREPNDRGFKIREGDNMFQV